MGSEVCVAVDGGLVERLGFGFGCLSFACGNSFSERGALVPGVGDVAGGSSDGGCVAGAVSGGGSE